MKRKRSIVIVSISVIVAALAITCALNWGTIKSVFVPKSCVKISYSASSVDDLIADSPVIVTVKATGVSKNINYEGVDFVTTKLKVQKVLKSENPCENEITLLQTVCNEDPIVQKDGSYLLFLHKYEGPVTDNAYVCKGLYQGQYKLDGTAIKQVKDTKDALSRDVNSVKTIESLEKKISSAEEKKS